MRRPTTRVLPSLDVLESRELLSMAPHVLSPHALTVVVRDVQAILGKLERTNDTAQASAHLTRLSSRIPHGREALASSWQEDLALYQPGSPGSIRAAEQQILGDLYGYVLSRHVGARSPGNGAGSASSTPPGLSTTGMGLGARGTTIPVPAPSLDSVRIENTTGLELRVTISLETPHTPQPFLTEIIPAQGTTVALFDFGSNTDAFMTMNISRADGIPGPPPFDGVSLSQPMSGYNAALFDISLSGFSFNVTPQ